ncbi:MAG: DUF2339 domain-containing protein [Ardenticatenaceae bacterium]|nr:DUF2339 domain-containing protein [Ardenticatenaceae bacterium]
MTNQQLSNQSPDESSPGFNSSDQFSLNRLEQYFTADKVVSYIGILLLLIGVGFLFNYAIEQGWLIPTVRVGFGLLLGVGLIGVGLLSEKKRSVLAGILMGGGCTVLYFTIFASYALYNLTTNPIAFGAMGGVTLASYFLAAVRREGYLLMLVGLAGGLITPFLLGGDAADLTPLVVYLSLIVTAAVGIAYYREWPSLTMLAGVGIWIAWLGIILQTLDLFSFSPRSGAEWIQEWLLTGGVLYSWLLLTAGLAITVRYENRQRPAMTFFTYAFLTLTAVATFVLLGCIWLSDGMIWGSIALGAALIYAVGAMSWREHFENVVVERLGGTLAIILLTAAVVAIFDGPILLILLAGEALLLHGLTHQWEHPLPLVGAWLLTLIVGFAFMARLLMLERTIPIFNSDSLTNLTLLTSLGATAFICLPQKARGPMQLIVYCFTLIYFWAELAWSTNGQGIISLIWGGMGIGLLAAGFYANQPNMQRTGLVTLLVIAGKLLLIDLLEIDPFWRILLFIGFGLIFLTIGYVLPDIWKFNANNRPVDSEVVTITLEPVDEE